MTTWKIKINNKFYAKFEFDKKLVLVEQSDQARIDGLQNKLGKEYEVFDPRKTTFVKIKTPKDIYDADLYLSEVFHDQEFTKYSEGLDWSKVLEPDRPGIVH